MAVERTFVLFDTFRFIRRRARDDAATGMATTTRTAAATTRGGAPRVGRGGSRLRRARESARDDAGTRSVENAGTRDARATTRATMGDAADAAEVLQWEDVRAGEGVRVDDARWARGGDAASGDYRAETRETRSRARRRAFDDGSGEAMFGRDDFDGARDARVAIEGARRGTTLSGTSLGELGSTDARETFGRKIGGGRGGKEALREIEEAL